MSFYKNLIESKFKWIKTKKTKFLSEMDKIIPREQFLEKVSKKYVYAHTWRPRYSHELMLKIYFLQSRFNLSDPDMEDALYENITFQRYCWIDIATDEIPDETTILNFRHFLEKHKLPKKFFEVTNRLLEKNNILLKKWTIVDATIINAPSSTKNKDKKRDPEMHSTKKWNQRYFWWKAHIGVDKDSGLVHSLEITSANVHDSEKFVDLTHWEEEVVYWDSAYQSKDLKNYFEWKSVEYEVHERAYRWKPLSEEQKLKNRWKSSVRCKVEWCFQILKEKFWFRKFKYRWMYKNWIQLYTLFTMINLFKARHKLANFVV
jgi:transposase, IS5 family